MKKHLKKNLFLGLVALAYLLTFIFKAEAGIAALWKSLDLLKEMLIVLPPVLIISALLMVWVPNSLILKNLGTASGIKGKILAFAAGCLTAGPIYAAFPVCSTLRQKGASIHNIAIILSTWAIIKIPMVLLEIHFLGMKFAFARYLLSIPAVFLIAWLMGKLLKGSVSQDLSPLARTSHQELRSSAVDR